jgi:hypothetical protein
LDEFGRYQAQSPALQTADHFADQAALNRVGFDEYKRFFHGGLQVDTKCNLAKG